MNAPISIGNIQLTIVSGGQLWIDGGNMFGVVPRVMWERKSPPDDQHRIELATNCVLVRTAGSLGLIDTGYGGKVPAKHRLRYALEGGVPLARSLSAIGVAPDEIDWVILTHLHFDHAGGATLHDEKGRPVPMFPRARHIVQRSEWDDAMGDIPELAGAYYPDDFAPLEKARLLELVDGNTTVAAGVTTHVTGGHTRGHQIVRIESEGAGTRRPDQPGAGSAVCLADICPTVAHLPTFWSMAYDQFPLEVRRQKPIILNDIADHRRLALFSHDPRISAARIARSADNEWITVTGPGDAESSYR